jgi:hypothetical protein
MPQGCPDGGHAGEEGGAAVMYLACIVGMFALVVGAGWLLALLDPPPPVQRIPRVHYLGWSGSMWRERRK